MCEDKNIEKGDLSSVEMFTQVFEINSGGFH